MKRKMLKIKMIRTYFHCKNFEIKHSWTNEINIKKGGNADETCESIFFSIFSPWRWNIVFANSSIKRKESIIIFCTLSLPVLERKLQKANKRMRIC